MIRKLKSGEYRLYSRKIDAKKGTRRNLGTFKTRAAIPRATRCRAAYARSEDRMKALQAGSQMHVATPIDPAELVTIIASLAGRFVARAPDEEV